MSYLPKLAAISIPLLVFGTLRAGDSKKDQDSIQGAWDITEMVMSGKPAPAKLHKDIKIVFAGDTMTLTGPGNIGKRAYKFKLDPSKKPTALDAIPLEGPFKDKTAPSIYELQGDVLKLCMPNTETTTRPAEFKSPNGSHLAVIILKRAKK